MMPAQQPEAIAGSFTVDPIDSGSTEPLLQFFRFNHLPAELQTVSAHFAYLAHTVVATTPRNPERTTALRKLLEAKDCAVRAMLWSA